MIDNLKLRNVFSSLIYKNFFSKKKRFGNNLVALDYHYFTDNSITYPKLGLEVSYSVLEKQLKIFSELLAYKKLFSLKKSYKEKFKLNKNNVPYAIAFQYH